MEEHHLVIPRTVRYYTLGDARTATRLWVVLHGYGQLARFFLRKFQALGEDLFIVAPEGPNRHYLDGTYDRVGANWMTREDREAEIEDHVRYLDQLVDQLRKGPLHSAPIHVLGFSQGVATATRWALRGNTPVQRLVLWGGTIPPDADAASITARLQGTSVDLVRGEQDELVPTDAMDRSAALLLSTAPMVHVHAHPGGHELDTALLRTFFR